MMRAVADLVRGRVPAERGKRIRSTSCPGTLGVFIGDTWSTRPHDTDRGVPDGAHHARHRHQRGVPMKFSRSKKTLAAAVASMCALAAVPALSASAANSQGATQASQSRSVDGTSWNYDGTWTDKQGRTGVSHVKVQPQKFWASGDKLMMQSLVTTTNEGARG